MAKDDKAAALLPKDIAAGDTLTIRTSPNYSPNEFKEDSGNPIGWGIELSDAIAGKLGLTAEYTVANLQTAEASGASPGREMLNGCCSWVTRNSSVWSSTSSISSPTTWSTGWTM